MKMKGAELLLQQHPTLRLQQASPGPTLRTITKCMYVKYKQMFNFKY